MNPITFFKIISDIKKVSNKSGTVSRRTYFDYNFFFDGDAEIKDVKVFTSH